jgi:phosphatidylglycerophosphate synthase
MHSILRLIPNMLTLLRLILVPMLWVFAIVGEERMAGLALAVAAVTDILDGRLARAFKVTSAVGSRLDSIADSLVSFSAIGWLVLLEPDVLRNHPFYFSAAPLVAVTLLWLGWQKYRKVADFHLTSGRAAGVAGYLFLIQLFLFGRSLEPLLYMVMLLSWIVAIEAFVVVRTRDSLEERVTSPLASFVTGSAGRLRSRSS